MGDALCAVGRRAVCDAGCVRRAVGDARWATRGVFDVLWATRVVLLGDVLWATRGVRREVALSATISEHFQHQFPSTQPLPAGIPYTGIFGDRFNLAIWRFGSQSKWLARSTDGARGEARSP